MGTTRRFLFYELKDPESHTHATSPFRRWIDITIMMSQPAIKLLQKVLSFCSHDSTKLFCRFSRYVIVHDFSLEAWLLRFQIDIVIKGRDEIGGIGSKYL